MPVVEATRDNFREAVASGLALVDVWGPQCRECLALMPDVERIAEARGLTLVKLEAAKARRICIEMRVMSMPSLLLFSDGNELSRVGGQDLTPERIDAWLDESLPAGARGESPEASAARS